LLQVSFGRLTQARSELRTRPTAILLTRFTKQPWPAQTGKPQQEKEEPTSDQGVQKIEPTVSETAQHETNKTAVIIGVVGLAVLPAWHGVNAASDTFQTKRPPRPRSEAKCAIHETQPPAQPF